MKIKKYSERQKNISGAFQINQEHKNKIQGKKILLVDDICTTGSTLIECAKILQKLNPKSISGVVIARQS
jgi:predicted amidophosphoribosyltransferase